MNSYEIALKILRDLDFKWNIAMNEKYMGKLVVKTGDSWMAIKVKYEVT